MCKHQLNVHKYIKLLNHEINFDENNFYYKTIQNQNLKINYSQSCFNQSIKSRYIQIFIFSKGQ